MCLSKGSLPWFLRKGELERSTPPEIKGIIRQLKLIIVNDQNRDTMSGPISDICILGIFWDIRLGRFGLSEPSFLPKMVYARVFGFWLVETISVPKTELKLNYRNLNFFGFRTFTVKWMSKNQKRRIPYATEFGIWSFKPNANKPK